LNEKFILRVLFRSPLSGCMFRFLISFVCGFSGHGQRDEKYNRRERKPSLIKSSEESTLVLVTDFDKWKLILNAFKLSFALLTPLESSLLNFSCPFTFHFCLLFNFFAFLFLVELVIIFVAFLKCSWKHYCVINGAELVKINEIYLRVFKARSVKNFLN
jgi:hypothetical protein